MLDGTVRGLVAQPRAGLVSVGAVLSLWSASAAIVGLMDGLNVAYRVEEGRPWWRIRLVALALTVGLSLLWIVAFALAAFGAPLIRLAADPLLFTLGFGAASGVFSYDVSNFGSYNATHGSLGAVIVLLFWMYLLGSFLLVGGEVNALLEHTSPAGKDVGEKVPGAESAAAPARTPARG